MNVYTNCNFTGHYPVGTAAVVVADSAEQACELLNQSLRERLLAGDAKVEDMRRVPIHDQPPSVTILCDGNY